MAMIMDIPAPPATRPAAQAKSEKTAQGSEDGFQTALNEENLKQAKGSGAKGNPEKPKTEQNDESREVADQAAAAGAAGVTAQWAETPDAIVETEGSALSAAGSETRAAAVLTQGAADGGKPAAEVPLQAAAETAPEIPQETGLKTQTPVVPVPGAGDTAEVAAKATRPEAGANRTGEVHVPEPAAPAPGATAQVVLQQPVAGQADRQESKTQTGLMEASFAGLLQPVATKGQPVKGNALPEALPETGAAAIGKETASAQAASQPVAIEKAESDLSEALLKESGDQPETAESWKTADKGQPSPFDSALASAGPAKPGTIGEAAPLQNAAEHMRSAAGNLNEEVRVLDQVLNQLPLNRMGDKNRIVIRLHPEELGEVKLDLVMDKDQLKAHLVTQTQQVQGILEKHLPRLQEALQNQGIKLDQIEVSVDSQGNQGREFFDRNNQSAPWVRSFGHHPAVAEPARAATTASQSRSSQSGLSLRI